MNLEILFDLLQAIGLFWVNPLLYMAILIAIYLGYRRVKKERQSFHIRILNGWSELRNSLWAGLGLSLMMSVLMIAAGVVLAPSLLFVLIIVTFVAMLSFVFHLLSPAVLFAGTMVLMLVLDMTETSFQIFGTTIAGIEWLDEAIPPFVITAGLFVIIEAVLIRRYGPQFATPRMEQTKRGMQAAAYLSKQLWILPMVVLIPGDVIPSFIPYWPQFMLGETAFSFVCFPFVIGFQQVTRKTLPVYFYPKLAKVVLPMGVLLVVGGIVGFFAPAVSFIVLMIGALCRIWIAVQFKLQERNDLYAVAPTTNGAMIIAVLPDSPAEKMGLVAGEMIKRVNGQDVFNERQLYEALQINAAHCKLEVLDYQKELRLTQHVIHSDDHHSIGLILAK